MMAQQIVNALPAILIIMGILSLVLFMLALQQLRRGRTGPYWRARRNAGQRGGRLFLASIGLFVLTVALAVYSGLAGIAYNQINLLLANDPSGLKGVALPTATDPNDPTRTPTATITPIPPTWTTTPTATSSATPSATPSGTPSATATATPTITQTPTITWTPTATFESVLNLTPVSSTREPRQDAAINLTTAAAGVNPDGTPRDPGNAFPPGSTRIFLFFDYSQMDNGLAWSRILYREGVPIQGQSYQWNMGESGSAYFFFGDQNGYPPGHYEVRLFLGADEISRLAFTVEDS